MQQNRNANALYTPIKQANTLVSWAEITVVHFSRKFCVYDEIFDKVLAIYVRKKELLAKFERLKIRSKFYVQIRHIYMVFADSITYSLLL